jgi:hypothetical protein
MNEFSILGSEFQLLSLCFDIADNLVNVEFCYFK